MFLKSALFIVFIVLLLSSPALAQDFRDEEIWVYHGNFELGVQERANAQEYTVKVHEIDTDKSTALLLVYKNSRYQESFFVDTDANKEHTFDDSLSIKVLDIGEKLKLDLHVCETGRVWVQETPKTPMEVGDEIMVPGFNVKLTDIIGDKAWITLSKDDGESLTEGYARGDSKKYFDQIMIKVIHVDEEKAFVEIYSTGNPALEMRITGLGENYDPDETINYDVIVKNNGTVPLRGIILEVNNGKGTGEDVYECQLINPSKEYVFHLNITPPEYPEGDDIEIMAQVRGYDYREIEYFSSATARTYIGPYIAIEKIVSPDEVYLNKVVRGEQEAFQITLKVHNMANTGKTLKIEDDIPDTFLPVDIEHPEWTLKMQPGSTEEITYMAIPTEAGTFTLTHATARWADGGKTYTKESSEPEIKVDVSGVRISVDRDTNPGTVEVGENVEVMVTLTNRGDTIADISFSDKLPRGVKLVSGETDVEATLYPLEKKSFTYTIKTEDPGQVELPELEVYYVDPDGNKGWAYSDSTSVYTGDIKEDIPQTDTQERSEKGEESLSGEFTKWKGAKFLLSSFMTILAIVGTVPVAAYILINRRS